MSFFWRVFALHEGVQEKSKLKIVNVQVIANPESHQMSFYSKNLSWTAGVTSLPLAIGQILLRTGLWCQSMTTTSAFPSRIFYIILHGCSSCLKEVIFRVLHCM